MKTPYGYDPYNSADAAALGRRIVGNFNGPLGPIAYRSQAAWDRAPANVQGAARYAAWQQAVRS
jgi:hypothetical protein